MECMLDVWHQTARASPIIDGRVMAEWLPGGRVALTLWVPRSKLAPNTWSNSLRSDIYHVTSARGYIPMFLPYITNVFKLTHWYTIADIIWWYSHLKTNKDGKYDSNGKCWFFWHDDDDESDTYPFDHLLDLNGTVEHIQTPYITNIKEVTEATNYISSTLSPAYTQQSSRYFTVSVQRMRNAT